MYNKIDAISLEQVDKLAREDHTVVISCEMNLKWVDRDLSAELIDLICFSLDYLIERMWEALGLVRVYTKKRGEHPNLNYPDCLRKGATIEVCNIADFASLY